MKDVVIFYGYKGSGKDTCYELLKEVSGKKVTKISFAGPLRETIWNLFKTKIKDQRLINGSIKEKETPIVGWEIPENVKKDCGFEETYWTGRRLLQWFGTEVCRNVYDNVWIDAFKDQLNSVDADVICVTDCRFKNEYETLFNLDKTKYKVRFVKVERITEDNEYSTHASEKDLEFFKYDMVIYNDKTMETLRDTINSFCLEYINT